MSVLQPTADGCTTAQLAASNAMRQAVHEAMDEEYIPRYHALWAVRRLHKLPMLALEQIGADAELPMMSASLVHERCGLKKQA